MLNEAIPKPRKGRSLELLVKRIKEHQSPDAQIRSPEFIIDCDTGQLREVDIGIHVPRNNGTLFIAIECRDRGSVQAVEWIEQLISKKNSISADVLVAITSSNFTKPSRIKALRHGVLLGRISRKLPEELANLASSFFITLKFLCPKILQIDLGVPSFLTHNLESYKYKHDQVDEHLSFAELSQMWSNPNLIRTIPKFVTDWSKDKFAKIELAEINASIVIDDQLHRIQRAQIYYELGYTEMQLSLRAVQELNALDQTASMDAMAFAYGTDDRELSEVIVDSETGELRWDLLGKEILTEGKVLIGADLKASQPVSITTMRVDL